MTWFLPEPMLTVTVDNPVLHAGRAAEPKWDDYRAQLAVYAGGRVLLRSRRGTDMTAAFPGIKAAALTLLPADTGLDGVLVVWEEDRLACERLQQRLARRGPLAAAEAARQWPAHYVAFDLVHAAGTDLTGWPYQRRRAALGALFTDHQLSAPLTLCPWTADPAEAAQWLGWTAAGLEGLCFKRLTGPYRPVRSWQKYKVRVTTEAIIGAITGPTDAPRTVLLGRYDNAGRLQYTGRTTTLSLDRRPGPGRRTVPAEGCASVGGVDVLDRLGHPARLRSSWWSPRWCWRLSSMSPGRVPAGSGKRPGPTAPV
ncbi:ATP-dependent DNA ligase [Streptomyces griseofuscus]|uniref:ATP-dependent DNA ligase n=1 Tax=Streptomyces griseofuscus TaxID=146922 RepID=UPI00341D4648